MCTAPEDYESVTTQYTFMPGDQRLDIPVTIVDNCDFEDVEQFLGRLSTSFAAAIIDVPQTDMFIDDDDRKLMLVVSVHKLINFSLREMDESYYACT